MLVKTVNRRADDVRRWSRGPELLVGVAKGDQGALKRAGYNPDRRGPRWTISGDLRQTCDIFADPQAKRS